MTDLRWMSRREALAAAGLTLLAPYAAACGGDDEEEGDQGGTSTELTQVDFRLDWQLEARQAPFIVARDNGYFEEEGLEVNIAAGTSSADNLKFLSQDRIQFGLIDGMSAVQGRSEGIDAVSLGVYFQRIPSCVTSLVDSPIDSLEEMVGKTIGTSPGSASDVATRELLEERGIEISEIEFADTGFSATPLVVERVDGLIDFAMAGPPTIENAGKEPHVLLLADEGLAGYGASLCVTDSYLADNTDVVDGFVRAVQKGIQDVVDDPDSGLDAVLEEMQNPDEELEQLKMDAALPFYSSDLTEGDGFLAQTEDGWADTVKSAETIGLLEEAAPAPADMFAPDSPATVG